MQRPVSWTNEERPQINNSNVALKLLARRLRRRPAAHVFEVTLEPAEGQGERPAEPFKHRVYANGNIQSYVLQARNTVLHDSENTS